MYQYERKLREAEKHEVKHIEQMLEKIYKQINQEKICYTIDRISKINFISDYISYYWDYPLQSGY